MKQPALAAAIRRRTPSQLGSKVLGLEAGVAGYACQHSGAKFDRIVKRKDKIRKACACENTMGGAALPLDLPADAQQRGFNMSGFG